MLSRYDGKKIKLITTDGEVFEGFAEVFPPGYGLDVFDIEEESILLDETHIFLSDIDKIEVLSSPASGEAMDDQCSELIKSLIDLPYRIADILPIPVPNDAGGQYFAVDKYFRKPVQMKRIRLRQAEVLLKLNCYYDMAVSFDSCASWETNPDPEAFVERVINLTGNDFLRAVFAGQNAMIDCEPEETWLTVYDPDEALLPRLSALAAAEGFFVWSPPQEDI